jgi:hypothetical protein
MPGGKERKERKNESGRAKREKESWREEEEERGSSPSPRVSDSLSTVPHHNF